MTAGVSVGSVLADRYELTRELAGGGMGTVFIADDTLLSRPVAVKVLHPELARDPGIRERFHHEALAAARLSHPGIVATYDTGDSDGIAYIVMELADGGTLREILDGRPMMPLDVAADIAAQVADALENAHRHGVIHRDVKPGNILVRSDGRVQVVDFGIAKATGAADLTRTGMVIGTARYLAPEQAQGNAIDPRADVYSLGLVLYEMLTGQVPFTRDTDMATAAARLTNYARPVRELRPEASPALEAVVMHALAREPADRYQSAGAFASAIRDAASGRVEEPAKPRPAPRPTPQPTPAPAYQPAVRSSPRKSSPRSDTRTRWPGSSSSSLWREPPLPSRGQSRRPPRTTPRPRPRFPSMVPELVPELVPEPVPEPDSDTELALAAAAGDRVALETLLERHADRIHRLCLRVVRDHTDALDATQEAMIAVARGIDRFDGRSAFTTWLYRVATNAAIEETRRRGRRPVPTDTTPEMVATAPGPESTATDRLDVRSALASVPDELRSALLLRDVEELEYAEIAEVLGVPIGTVRSRISRGRRSLARILGNSRGSRDAIRETHHD